MHEELVLKEATKESIKWPSTIWIWPMQSHFFTLGNFLEARSGQRWPDCHPGKPEEQESMRQVGADLPTAHLLLV